MEDTTGIFEDVLCVLIEEDGEKLTISAKQIEKDQWELSIKNAYGINSVWFEYFNSAQEAIDAGIKAIKEEGVKAFSSTEGFEYLHE